jgi:radical SAM superfamily enzyme YgiQ (UPF0313 family)
MKQSKIQLKIILINPPVNYLEHDSLPPLGLLSLAAMVKEHNISILDCVNKKIKPQNILKSIPYDTDIIGISCNYTNNVNNVIKIANTIKKHRDTFIFCGGTHATFDYENLLRKGIDFVVMHEGEETFKELVEWLSKNKTTNTTKTNTTTINTATGTKTQFGNQEQWTKKQLTKEQQINQSLNQPNNQTLNQNITKPKKAVLKNLRIKGISYKEDDKFIVNPERQLIDMDNLPMPAWELINEKDYKTSYGIESAIETGRGCNFNCSYCVSCRMWKHKHRYKSAERITAEFMDAQKRGVKILHLYADENFTANPDMIIEICKKLIQQNNRIAWVCGGRADSIAKNPEMLTYMKRAGCIMLGLGYESQNNLILRSYCKTTSEKINQRASKLIRKSGMISEGGFIFGAEKETPTTIFKTLLFSLQLDFANYSILRPYPGTKYWNEKYRPYLDRLNSSVSLLHKHPWMIEWAQKIATLVFYLHPKTIIKMIVGKPYQKYIARRWYAKIFSIGVFELKYIIGIKK